MKVNIIRIDKSLPLPKYETDGAVGFDFVCRESCIIKPKQLNLIPGNVVVEVPEGFMLSVLPRSSTPKKGLFLANSMGVIDNDYCGPKDEIKILVFNYTDNDVFINKGDRIAQGIFFKIQKVTFNELSKTNKKQNRNGFGSTGN